MSLNLNVKLKKKYNPIKSITDVFGPMVHIKKIEFILA